MKDNLDISIQKLLNRANRLISSRVGVIKGIYPAFTQHFDPQTFSYGTEKTDTSKFFFHKAPEKGGAAGETWKSAYIASIGEAIERYCCALYDPGCLVFDSYLNLSEHTSAVHPRDFALFSETQYKKKDFPYLPFTESSQISWVKGFSLTKEHDIYVPAQTVFLPFTRQKKEMPICPITSTGLAAGPTLEFAALTALYEIIERDAFTITWLMRLPPKKVDVRNFSETYSFFKSRFVYNNFDYMFYDITLDINIPTTMVILKGTIEIGDILGVGCGTRDTMGDSLKKALLEVSQLPPWIRYAYQKEPNWTCRDDFLDINNFDDHGQLYTRRRDLIEKAFSFLKRTKRKKGYKNPQLNIRSHGEKLKHCINILQKHGYDIIMCDLSTSDVKDAGFKVVRIVVPGLIPLHGDHRYPFLGGQRLYKVPRKLGLRKLVNEISVNPYPHPSA